MHSYQYGMLVVSSPMLFLFSTRLWQFVVVVTNVTRVLVRFVR